MKPLFVRWWVRSEARRHGRSRSRGPTLCRHLETLERRLALTAGQQFAVDFNPILSIVIDGEAQVIPVDIGTNPSRPVHTHDASGVLDVESNDVRNFRLDEFFAAWDETIRNNGSPDFDARGHEVRCRLIGADLEITVNDAPVAAHFRSIVLRDDDEIQIMATTHAPTVTTGNLFPGVTRGAFDDPGLLGDRTDLQPGAPAITAEHRDGVIDYSQHSNPPTYGDHHPAPLSTGVYTTEQADADLVHNLEHGHVWISYNPTLLSATDQAALQQLVRDGAGNTTGAGVGVILTPSATNDSAVALASWAHLLTLDTFNATTIRDFVRTNRGHAPEGFITP